MYSVDNLPGSIHMGGAHQELCYKELLGCLQVIFTRLNAFNFNGQGGEKSLREDVKKFQDSVWEHQKNGD